MASIKHKVAVKMVFILSKIGAHKKALTWVDRTLNDKVSLNQLRHAVIAAKSNGHEYLLDKYIFEAISRYPSNSFGYVEKAASLVAKGRTFEAMEFLERAPDSRAKQLALVKIKSTQNISKTTKTHSASTPKINTKSKPKIKFEPTLKANPLEREILNAGNDAALLLSIEKKVRYSIAMQPHEESNYSILIKILEKLKRHADLVHTLSAMPFGMSKSLNYKLLLANSHQHLGEHTLAYETLISAQIDYPADRRLLMRISDAARDDAQPLKAYSYIRAARACYPEYGAVRQLSFEIDHKLLSEAKETFLHVLRYQTIVFLKFLPLFNRAMPFFPEYRSEVQTARLKARQLLNSETARKGINPSDQLRVAVKSRWIDEAKRIALRAARGTQPVTPERLSWLQTVVDNIGENRLLFDIASTNENSDELYGIYRGTTISLIESGLSPSNVVELFIPTVFFANPREEKASYSTVREFLSTIFKYVKTKKDFILVPRHQWNWRYCDPRVEGARIISYHTNAKPNPKHLHVQELSLAGRCSMDNEGFAGYSSISHDFEKIRTYSVNHNPYILIANLEKIASEYIPNNISKYGQSETREVFSGDYVFVALQIPTDTVASLAYVDGIALVTAVAEHYKNSPTTVIVKRHPYCNSKSVERCLTDLQSSSRVVLSNASVHDLISNAKMVFTVNSGVGLEALLHKKPVIVTGECDYAYAVSAFARSISELKIILTSHNSFDITRASELMNYYTNFYSARSDDKTAIHNRLENWLKQ